MKINWGTGIVISFIIFTLAIAFIIIFPFNQRIDLVTTDYYEQEIKYQDQIDMLERTLLLDESIFINQNEQAINIIFPSSYQEISGEIIFYRPADAGRDFSIPIKTDTSGLHSIDLRRLIPGYWKVKVLWNMNNLQYYYEKNIII
jgi:hypothetical protein